MPSAAALRHKIEHALERRFPAALSPAPRTRPEVAPTGITEVDELLAGGLPIGAISEVTGPEGSGRTSLALSFLGQRTQQDHVCAWVDVEDSLDPESAAANGVLLKQLLWVRCSGEQRGQKKKTDGKPWGRLDQALRATDLLLQAGGFSAIVLDMGGTAAEYARRIPLATWFRFRQAAQRTQCSLVVIVQRACAQSSADIVLECKAVRANAGSVTVLAGLTYQVRRERARGWDDGDPEQRLHRVNGRDFSRLEDTEEKHAQLGQVSGHGFRRADISSLYLDSEWVLAHEETGAEARNHFDLLAAVRAKAPTNPADEESFPAKILSFTPAQELSGYEASTRQRRPPVSTWSAAGAWDTEKRA